MVFGGGPLSQRRDVPDEPDRAIRCHQDVAGRRTNSDLGHVGDSVGDFRRNAQQLGARRNEKTEGVLRLNRAHEDLSLFAEVFALGAPPAPSASVPGRPRVCPRLWLRFRLRRRTPCPTPQTRGFARRKVGEADGRGMFNPCGRWAWMSEPNGLGSRCQTSWA